MASFLTSLVTLFKGLLLSQALFSYLKMVVGKAELKGMEFMTQL